MLLLCYNTWIQINFTTCNPLSHYNESFPINLVLCNHMAISLTLKGTSATTLTIRSTKERSPGDLPPGLMNIYSKKMAGKKDGKILLEYCHPRLHWYVTLLLYLQPISKLTSQCEIRTLWTKVTTNNWGLSFDMSTGCIDRSKASWIWQCEVCKRP